MLVGHVSLERLMGFMDKRIHADVLCTAREVSEVLLFPHHHHMLLRQT